MRGRIQLEDGTFLDTREDCPFCGEPVEWSYGGGLGTLQAFEKGSDGDTARMHFPTCYKVEEMRMSERNALEKPQ